MVDVNIFPGYKGFPNFSQTYHRHLREEAVLRAVAADSASLLTVDTVKRVCAVAVPSWAADDSLQSDPAALLGVVHIKSHNNNIFRVGRTGSNGADHSVIYRIGGQRFRRRPWREINLLAWLQRQGLGAALIAPVVPE